MSFFRHREIFRSDLFESVRERRQRRPRPHRLDEFPVGYSSADCSPAGSASASPTVDHSALMSYRRSILFHRTANSVLTVCLSSGDHRKSPFRRLKKQIKRFLLSFDESANRSFAAHGEPGHNRWMNNSSELAKDRSMYGVREPIMLCFTVRRQVYVRSRLVTHDEKRTLVSANPASVRRMSLKPWSGST